jgi:hypothetical protein
MTTQETISLTLDESISMLRRYVKYSEVKNQKHIDLSLALAEDRPIAQKALIKTRNAVINQEITEEQLKERLGLE